MTIGPNADDPNLPHNIKVEEFYHNLKKDRPANKIQKPIPNSEYKGCPDIRDYTTRESWDIKYSKTIEPKIFDVDKIEESRGWCYYIVKYTPDGKLEWIKSPKNIKPAGKTIYYHDNHLEFLKYIDVVKEYVGNFNLEPKPERQEGDTEASNDPYFYPTHENNTQTNQKLSDFLP